MITPWSTNAVEITQNMGIEGIDRIEEYFAFEEKTGFDPMLQVKYNGLHQEIFTVDTKPEEIIHIEDIASYNEKEGLALSQDEVDYLNKVSEEIGRKLTDSEVFGFLKSTPNTVDTKYLTEPSLSMVKKKKPVFSN